MTAYDPLVGYLHSEHLRWSYGGAAGGRADIWQKWVSGMPKEEMLKVLALAGFAGLYIDTYGYERGSAVESEISDLLRQAPMVSKNGRLAFFNLQSFAAEFRRKYSSQEWSLVGDQWLNPPSVNFGQGFSSEESDGTRLWCWSTSPSAQLQLTNPLSYPVSVRFECSIFTGHPLPSDVQLSGDGMKMDLRVKSSGSVISKTILVPPGDSSISISTNAERVAAPNEPRTLFLRFQGTRLLPDKELP
jgi:hypothetical protein